MWKIVFPPFVALQQTATRVAITFLFLNIDAWSRKHKKNEEWLSVWFFFLTESKSIFSRVHECQFFWFIRKLSNHFSSSFQPLCFETDSLFEPRLWENLNLKTNPGDPPLFFNPNKKALSSVSNVGKGLKKNLAFRTMNLKWKL